MAADCPTTDPKPGKIDFARDVLSRYVCNGLDEGLSPQPGIGPSARQ